MMVDRTKANATLARSCQFRLGRLIVGVEQERGPGKRPRKEALWPHHTHTIQLAKALRSWEVHNIYNAIS